MNSINKHIVQLFVKYITFPNKLPFGNLDCEILDYTTKEYLDKEYKDRLEWTHGAKSIDRGLQITKWLSEEKYDINFYVVIDDDLDAEFGHTENFFAVNSMTGFDENTLKRFRIYMRTFLC